MNFTYTVTPTIGTVLYLKGVERKVHAASIAGVRDSVEHGVVIVKAHASGRPGPNVIDDNFRGESIKGAMAIAPQAVQGAIYSDAAQALRLEFGFYGRDSLGRNYNQGPFPSFGPAYPEIRTYTFNSVAQHIVRVL